MVSLSSIDFTFSISNFLPGLWHSSGILPSFREGLQIFGDLCAKNTKNLIYRVLEPIVLPAGILGELNKMKLYFCMIQSIVIPDWLGLRTSIQYIQIPGIFLKSDMDWNPRLKCMSSWLYMKSECERTDQSPWTVHGVAFLGTAHDPSFDLLSTRHKLVG